MKTGFQRSRYQHLAAAAVLGAAAALVACSTQAPPPAPPPPEPIVANDTVPLAAAAPQAAEVRNEALAQSNAVRSTHDSVAKAATGHTEQKRAAAPLSSVAVTGSLLLAPQPPPPPPAYLSSPEDRERYEALKSSPVFVAADSPVSTFSVDVDTGAYSNVRRCLNEGRLPPSDAVRVEELINYFDYAYEGPSDRKTPFALHTEMGPSPWNSNTELLAIGIQGWKPADAAIRPSNLVFLVDVSGSMMDPNKLPLVKASLKLLANELTAKDRISLVVYAGRTEVVLEPTPGDQTATIVAALDRLEAGGSTNGAGGIQLAYAMAEKGFIAGGNNRVLLATDGDFNVGISDTRQLKSLVEDKRRSGVALSTLGYGGGNYNDALMEQIADVGNGHYSYIDTLSEARRVLVDERASALETIAKDVKIQVEFNPAVVAEYRLIGYENRVLNREDFNNDAIDAGDIGAGHRVTALYEIARVGSGGAKVDPLRYGSDKSATPKPVGKASERPLELAFLRLRYKNPDDGETAKSKLIERVIGAGDAVAANQTSPAFKLAAAVAAYGQILRGGEYTDRYAFRDVAALAQSALAARADQASGRTAEFIELAKLAGGLQSRQASNDKREGVD